MIAETLIRCANPRCKSAKIGAPRPVFTGRLAPGASTFKVQCRECHAWTRVDVVSADGKTWQETAMPA